jgi:predicted amidophosphoribosyltransferase
MRELVADIADLLFPSSCVGCDRPGRALCALCEPAVRDQPFRVQPGARASPGCWAGGAYDGVLRALILGYKERQRHDIADPLAGLLSRVVLGALGAVPEPVWLVPVPSGPAAARARGGEHVNRLAIRAARALRGVGVQAHAVPALRIAGPRRDSAGLGAAERAGNVAGAFAIRPGLLRPAGSVFVADDIVTTGATLREAARTLAMAGRAPVAAAVLAATPRRAAAGALTAVASAGNEGFARVHTG